MPEATAPAQIVLDGDALRRAIKQIRHAAAETWSRPILRSIAFHAEGEALRLVAADNFRLATLTLPVASGDLAAVVPFVLGLHDADHLRSFVKRSRPGPLVVGRSDRVVTFSIGARSVSYEAVDGVYPDYGVVTRLADARADVLGIRISPSLLAGLVDTGAPGLEMTLGEPNDVVVFADLNSDFREYLMPVRTPGAPIPEHLRPANPLHVVEEPTDA